MPTALCTQQTLKHSLKILPLLLKAIFAQSPQVWDTSPLLGVTSRSPGVRGSLCWAWGWPCPPPATVPWWEKTGQSLVCPRGAGLGELSCRPQGGAGRGERNAEKVRRNAPGCASRRDGGKTSATARPALPQRGSQGRQTPQSSLRCPQDGAKTQRCGACPVPLDSTRFSPKFPRKDDCHQHATGHYTHTAAGAPPCGGHRCSLSQESPSPRLLIPLVRVRTRHRDSEGSGMTNGWITVLPTLGIHQPLPHARVQGVWSAQGMARTMPWPLPWSQQLCWHCPCPDPPLTSSLACPKPCPCVSPAAAGDARGRRMGECSESSVATPSCSRQRWAESELGPPRGYNTAPFPLSRQASAAGNVL